MDQQLSLKQPNEEEFRRALALRHKLAMESIGVIRSCIHVQEPMFRALMELEKNPALAGGSYQSIVQGKSFALQIRMAKLTLEYMDQLDAIAEEVVDLAIKERN